MSPRAWLGLVLLLAACAKEAPDAPDPAPAPPQTPPPEAKRADEPKRILIERILINFKGNPYEPAKRFASSRSKERAERLAESLYRRIEAGADFEALKREYSDDRSSDGYANGPYILCNFNVRTRLRPDSVPELGRADLTRGFADTAFALEVGKVGLAKYHPKTTPYGWDIIKRVR